jgi:hypothetical protein
MTTAVEQPTFGVQLALWNEGTVTLVCDVCHGHTVLSQEYLYRLAPDRIGCYECGAVNELPTKECL